MSCSARLPTGARTAPKTMPATPKRSKTPAVATAADIDAEAAQAAALLQEAMLGTPPARKTGKETSSPPVAPSGGGGSRRWRSRRAKYAHLPPITITLKMAPPSTRDITAELRDGPREELRVDEFARCKDLVRDLATGGPEPSVRNNLGVTRALKVTGLSSNGAPVPSDAQLEEGTTYEVHCVDRSLTQNGEDDGSSEDWSEAETEAM